MLRCVKDHHVDGFGVIPAGSLWDDDSPYVVESECFVDADAPTITDEPAEPAPVRRAKKSAAPRKDD